MLRRICAGFLFLSLLMCGCRDASPSGDANAGAESKTGADKAPLPDIGKLVKRMTTQDGCKDFVAELRITSETESGKQSNVEVQLQRKYSATGASTFLRVLAPKADSDKAILAIEEDGKPTEAFSYLAGLNKLAKLNSSRPLGFQGAKVTVQELLGMELGHYQHDAGERVTVDGQPLIKVVFQAQPDFNLVFPRIVGYFREADQSPASFELFGENEELVKKLVIREMKTIQNYMTLTQIEIEDIAQKLKLKMETRKIEYNQGLSDKLFTEQYLKSFITDASNKRESGK